MTTTKLLKVVTGAALAMIVVGCGGYGYPIGSLYTGTQVPHGININETSGTSILGLYTQGCTEVHGK